jgi:hypothetical protein
MRGGRVRERYERRGKAGRSIERIGETGLGRKERRKRKEAREREKGEVEDGKI